LLILAAQNIKQKVRKNEMLKRIASRFIGSFVLFLLVLNTLFCAVVLFPLALIKFIIPIPWWRFITGKVLIRVASNWVFVNSFFIHLFYPIHWRITGIEKLEKNDWYLVISNHQSWIDIVVLQKVLYGKIPFIKFFLKKELIWVPVIGLAWWALDFPFMKRFTKEEIEKNPRLKGKDIEITRKACEKFKTDYVAVMTFPEGTRFTKEKHDKQNSPYKHLLKPKAGGLSFTISAMGDRFNGLLNITIIYPDGVRSIWEFLCGKVRRINVIVETLPIPDKFATADINDAAFKSEFNDWLNGIWLKKDNLIDSNRESDWITVNPV
jgi:1-acyl-sn-glycerol-3-phosphate acyltransferase